MKIKTLIKVLNTTENNINKRIDFLQRRVYWDKNKINSNYSYILQLTTLIILSTSISDTNSSNNLCLPQCSLQTFEHLHPI